MHTINNIKTVTLGQTTAGLLNL